MSIDYSKAVTGSPGAADADVDGIHPDGEEGDATASVHPDLWRAMVSESPGARWYMDLESLQVIRVPWADGAAMAPVAEEPARFAEIPTLATERQRGHARKVLAEHVGQDQAGFLTSEEPWLRHFHEHASPELRQVLSDARRAWVIGEVRAWMRTHDLPEYRFVRSSRPSAAAPRGPRAPRPRVVALREALHRAIDRMSERELEALGVPARLLVED